VLRFRAFRALIAALAGRLVLSTAAGLAVTLVSGGPKAFAEAAMRIFVYGLMVYLPACCIPAGRGSRAPRWWHCPLAVVLPSVFAIPVAAAIGVLHPVRIHHLPIAPGP
jgi:hypothetical protein